MCRRQLQRRGRIQLLGLHVLCGLLLDSDGLDSVCRRGGQLRPLPRRLCVLRRRRRRRRLLLLARLRVDGGWQLLLRGHAGYVRGLLSDERVRRGKLAAHQRLAVDGGVAVRVRRGDSRADGICKRGRRTVAVNDATACLRAGFIRKRRSRALRELPGGLLLRGRRGPPRRMRLRLLQRCGQRRLHALHLRRRLLLQCVVDERRRLRWHDRLVRALLRRHGMYGRRRRARELRRRQLLHAGRDVGGVHCLRRGRQLRSHRSRRVLQPSNRFSWRK